MNIRNHSIAKIAAAVMDDPLLFVKTVFPWGKGELENKKIRDWQARILNNVGEGLLNINKAIEIAVASGHGIGKSALVAWLILWAMTKPETKGFVTANTEAQLKTKTWAELSKWYNMCAIKDIFTLAKTAIYSSDPAYSNTWRIDAIPWSENNSEAFAGLHNEGKRVIMIFDEGSGIPDIIYQTAEGALTDANTQKIFCAFGNPTRPTGRFREFFGKSRSSMTAVYNIDSRSVPGTDGEQIEKWRTQYGEDSDFFRVRVRGQFPNTASASLIGEKTVDEAMKRIPDLSLWKDAPKILGVDAARFGEDKSAICFRQGRKVHYIKTYSGYDTMALAGEVARQWESVAPDAVFIDETGVGAGVYDRLKELGYRGIFGVNFGGKAGESGRYINKRSEMWGEMAEWLKGGSIPQDEELREDLIAPTYSFSSEGQLVLEKKSDMKKRGFSSPDRGDALALTFAEKVAPKGRYKPRITGRLR